MAFPGRNLWRQWGESRRFQALGAEQRRIVFYSEDAASLVHLKPVIDVLVGPLERSLVYLASQEDDPYLTDPPSGVTSFWIGDGTIRTSLFLGLRAGLMVMTMPDLETYQIKRSRAHPVHYAYLFHSLVSTHMIYRPGAFDHYDSVFCAGPHHVEEIRATEKQSGLDPKTLIEHGYVRLDELIEKRGQRGAPKRPGDGPLQVLIAPSWGEHGLLETRGEACVKALLAAGFRVIVRPHPMTRRKWPETIDRLTRGFGAEERFVLEEDMARWDSFFDSDLMISDWSGAALEYAFATERPVLFVDVPRKVNNPDYEAVGVTPIEVSIRSEIGEVVSPDRMDDLPGAVERLCADPEAFAGKIRELRSRTVYNPGRSAEVAAEKLAELAGHAKVG